MTDPLPRETPVRSSAAQKLQQAWLENEAPELESFLKNVGELESAELSALLRIDQRERWSRGEKILAERYLERFHTVAADSEAALDLVYAEYLLRERLGEEPDASAFVTRFPHLAEQLTAQIELHELSKTKNSHSTRELPAAGGEETLPGKTIPQPSEARELNGTFGRYNLVRLLGRGGMGEVYLAYDTLLHREVAIKVPRTTGKLDADTVERFYREARTAAKLLHPHLCAVYDVGEIEGQLFLAMPYLPGETLAETLRRGPLPQSRIVELVGKLALALAEAHRVGILHRDLKPGNIMLSERGEPVVMDFGLARLNQQHDLQLTASGTLLGTPAYAAPEQLMGEANLTPSCDIYSLGVILFELITGRTPFTGTLASMMKQVLVDLPPRPSALVAKVDPTLESICLRCLAKRPEDRFASMLSLAEALRQVGYFVVAEIVDSPTESPLQHETIPHEPPGSVPPQSVVPKVSSVAELKEPDSENSEIKASDPQPSTGNRYALRGCIAAVLGSLLLCGGLCGFGFYSLPTFVETVKMDFRPDPNWEDLARFWQAPAVMPPDFSQVSLPGMEFKQQNEVEKIPGFEIVLPARHALYHGKDGDIELFVAHASALEKEAVYRKVLEIIKQHDKREGEGDFHRDLSLPDYPHYPDTTRSGSATNRSLSYRHRRDYKKPGDAAVFWWDEDWLFLARSHEEADPRFFLRDVLAAINDKAPRPQSE